MNILKRNRHQVIKVIWLLAEFLRNRLAPPLRGTWLYRFLQHPSRFLRKHADWRQASKSGIFCRKEELDMCSLCPKLILDKVVSDLKPASLLDVGCGTGKALSYFVETGVDAIGIEASELAVAMSKYKERIVLADLREPINLGRKFDVVYSLEVVEHIHPDFVDVLVQNIGRHGDVIVMSAARPGQGGEGHFNEQPPEYWIQRFAERQFVLDEILTSQFRALPEIYADNMLVFKRSVPGAGAFAESERPA